MKIDLSGKVILITGSSRGIGSRLAKSLLEEGAHVVMNYNKSQEFAVNSYQQIRTHFDCMLVKADISDPRQAEGLVEEAIKRYGRVDIMINNAGINCDSAIIKMENWQWDNVIQTNLSGVFYCSRAVLHYMIQQNRGKIINIGSLIGFQGRALQANYSASKAALVGFTRSLAKEVAMFNISVNLICPGFIVTDLNRNDVKKKRQAEKQSAMPIVSAYDDLKNMLILLLSDEIKGITGQTFHLDSRI